MLRQERAGNMNNSTLPRFESMTRISKLPIVESAIGVASGLYGKVKGSNSVVSWTLTNAEVVSTAALVPVASRLETPLHAMDTFLCKGIDIVEEKVPAIKMPPRQMFDNTRGFVVAGLGLTSQGPDAPATARIIVAGVGVATSGLRTAVDAVEWYMNKYLPPQQGEDDGDEIYKEKDSKKEAGDVPEVAREVLLRMQVVSRRLHRRLTRIASARIKTFKQQREDATAYVGGVAEYITSHPKSLVLKVSTAWEEMAKQLQKEDSADKGRSRIIVRRFARGVVGILDNARLSITTIPGELTSRFDAAARYGMGIIGGMLEGTPKKNGTKDAVNGRDSDELAKLLSMRQEKGTSPPPAEPSAEPPAEPQAESSEEPPKPAEPPKLAVTSEKRSSTSEEISAKPGSSKNSEKPIVAN